MNAEPTPEVPLAAEKPLAAAQRRLGKRGRKLSTSRQARYRRRHPERAARDLARLRARKRKPEAPA